MNGMTVNLNPIYPALKAGFNNSSVKGSILTKLIEYRESIVLILYTKNISILTNNY